MAIVEIVIRVKSSWAKQSTKAIKMLPVWTQTVKIGLQMHLVTILVFSTKCLFIYRHTKVSSPISITSSKPESTKVILELQLEPEARADLPAVALLELIIVLKSTSYLLMCQAVFFMTPVMIATYEIAVLIVFAHAPQKFLELVHTGLKQRLAAVTTRRASRSTLLIEEAQIELELALIVTSQEGLAFASKEKTVMDSMVTDAVMLVLQIVQISSMERWVSIECIREKGLPRVMVLSTTVAIRSRVCSEAVSTMSVGVQPWSMVQSTKVIEWFCSIARHTVVTELVGSVAQSIITVAVAYMEQVITITSVEAARWGKEQHILSVAVAMRAYKPTQACKELVAAGVQLQQCKRYQQVKFWFAMDNQQAFEFRLIIVNRSLEFYKTEWEAWISTFEGLAVVIDTFTARVGVPIAVAVDKITAEFGVTGAAGTKKKLSLMVFLFRAEIAMVTGAGIELGGQRAADPDTTEMTAISINLFIVFAIDFFASIVVLKRASDQSGEGRKESNHEAQQVTYRDAKVHHISSVVYRRFYLLLHFMVTNLHTFHHSIPILLRHFIHHHHPLHRNSSSHIHHPHCHPLVHTNLHNFYQDDYVIGNGVTSNHTMVDRCHNKGSLWATFKLCQVYLYTRLRRKDVQKQV